MKPTKEMTVVYTSRTKSENREIIRTGSRLFLFLSFIAFGQNIALSQNSVNTTGVDATGTEGSLSYSIGQVFYTTNSGTIGSVAKGVQQPYEISEIVSTDEIEPNHLSVSIYPNPTTDLLTLKIEEYDLSNVSFQLHDNNGKVLQNGMIESEKTTLNVSDLPPSTYFVNLIENNKQIKTFKIIKH